MNKYSRRHFLGSGASALGLLVVNPFHGWGRSGSPSDQRQPPGGGPVAPQGADAQSAPAPEADAAPPQVPAPPPWEAIAPYGPGSAVTASWRVESLSGVVDGGAEVTLRHRSGRTACVRVVRRGSARIGIAQSERLDLLLKNYAKGTRPTDEMLARVIQAFADRIAEHERAHPSSPRALQSLWAPPAHYC